LNGAGLTQRGLQFLGVKLLLTMTPRPDLTWENPGPKPLRYTVPDPEPRARFVPATACRFVSADQIHRILRDDQTNLTDRLMLPIEQAPSLPPATTRVDPADLGLPRVVYRRPAPDRIDINVTADQDGYVRVIESFDPGWRATLDGAPVQILPGDDVFLAVRVPPGVHTLQFVYHTPGGAVGLAISGVSVVCLTLLGWVVNRQRLRSPAA
jgi:hypothetical protein